MVRDGTLEATRREDILLMRAVFLRSGYFLEAFIRIPMLLMQPAGESHWYFLRILFGNKRAEELFQRVNDGEPKIGAEGKKEIIKQIEKMSLEHFLRSPLALTDFE
ncbi:MAG: hypothetical protein HGB08_00170 [Candidatus Moranbacteria bacterium]|nr:hypothetical protein [Candidatus Moranbacteria bacterium]